MTDRQKPPPERILVTGGSGFIGTNLVEQFKRSGRPVMNVDIRPPRNPDHADVFTKADILDLPSLQDAFARFAPTEVVHMAARTDLGEEHDISGYEVNTTGTENVVAAVAKTPGIRRCIFTSTKLVCQGHYARSDQEYDPGTLYGRSKVISEQIVRGDTSMQADWCIVRPGSIWGPWFDVPYRNFFLAVSRGRYFHPGSADPPKSFGYVGNLVRQVVCLLEAPREQIHRRMFYLSDYETITIRQWADLIARKLALKPIRTIPGPVVRLVALLGDLLKAVGVGRVPLTSFRLANMRADTSGTPLEALAEITGPLPYSLDASVQETLAWLRDAELIEG